MRARVFGSLIVTVVGLIPTLIGGPIFVCLLIGLGMAGFREYIELSTRVGLHELDSITVAIGYGVVAALGLSALFGAGETTVFVICMIAIFGPLLTTARATTNRHGIQRWSMVSVGSLYLGLPIYAAIALRSLPNGVESRWLTEFTNQLSIGWDATPRGLAWTLTVVLATWVGDSTALLWGRAFGARKLSPNLSPNKTIEGAIGGLAGAVLVGSIAFPAFGLGVWGLGAFSGGMIGIVGQIGDLGESFLKRQAGVKDSGSWIPGHGGVLDRIDALLFAFPAGLVLATSVAR